jgi:hypothetical protein
MFTRSGKQIVFGIHSGFFKVLCDCGPFCCCCCDMPQPQKTEQKVSSNKFSEIRRQYRYVVSDFSLTSHQYLTNNKQQTTNNNNKSMVLRDDKETNTKTRTTHSSIFLFHSQNWRSHQKKFVYKTKRMLMLVEDKRREKLKFVVCGCC